MGALAGADQLVSGAVIEPAVPLKNAEYRMSNAELKAFIPHSIFCILHSPALIFLEPAVSEGENVASCRAYHFAWRPFPASLLTWLVRLLLTGRSL